MLAPSLHRTPRSPRVVLSPRTPRSLAAALSAARGRRRSAGSLLLFPLLLLFVLFAPAAHAHVGSKDVFQQVNVGPYKLFVTIRVPTVIPGIATIEVRSTGAPIESLHITPIPLTGEASKHPPSADLMKKPSADPNFYTGSVWLMATGSWQVQFDITGSGGPARAGVPVPAVPLKVLKMERPLGLFVAFMCLVLIVGFAGIVGAAVREASLRPNEIPAPGRRRRALIYAGSAALLALIVVALGNKWWGVEAAGYAADIYHPSVLRPVLNGNNLVLTIGRDTGGSGAGDAGKHFKARNTSDLLDDHGKLMHLYAIRWPDMDAVFHLHPSRTPDGTFQLGLPAMPPGTYRLYADIVHGNGFPETLTAGLTIPPGLVASPLGPDDAGALPSPLGPSRNETTSFELPDHYTMVWDRPGVLSANTPTIFTFRLLDPDGKPATDVQPYLGMAGHAAFVRTDGSVFAHTHPEGSAPMPSVLLANSNSGGGPSARTPAERLADTPGMNSASMPGMDMSAAQPSAPLPATVTFPYGFPRGGRYRIFIQMKHGNTIETGVFDARVL